MVSLVRAYRKETAVWAFNIADALPILPIPLNQNDEDSILDLGEAFRLAYEQNAYQDAINYKELPPPPNLTKEEIDFCKNIGVLV